MIRARRCRVGILFFGVGLATVRCGNPPSGPPSEGALTAVAPAEPARQRVGPMPPSAFRVEWRRPALPSRLIAGRTSIVMIELRNAGDQTWPDLASADKDVPGAFAVRLSYRWLDRNGKPIVDYAVRVDLPKPVGPGELIRIPIEIKAPTRSGRYQCQFDLVQELVAWFEGKGAAKLVVPVEVGDDS